MTDFFKRNLYLL